MKRVVWVVGRKWRARALLRAQLREEGYEALGMETAADALEALGRPGSSVPDVLFLDPRGGTLGPGEASLLGRIAASPPPEVLVLAGAGEECPVAHAAVVRRPVSIAALVDRIRRLVSR